MFKKEGVTYEYHHIGIPTKEPKPNEFYSKKFDIWTADVENSRIDAQWHRFGESHPFHPVMEALPHVAFKVNDIEKAVEGEEVIMEIYEPIPGFKAAMIIDAGLPIEFVETEFTAEELRKKAESGESVVRDVSKDE